MTTSAGELLARCAAIEGEAVPDADTTGAGLAWGERCPYFTNTLDSVDYEGDGESYERRVYTIGIRLVLVPLGSALDGGDEAQLYALAAAVEDGFAARRGLTSAAYPDPPVDLDPLGARLRRCGGPVTFVQGGAGVQHLGIEWTLTAGLRLPLET